MKERYCKNTKLQKLNKYKLKEKKSSVIPKMMKYLIRNTWWEYGDEHKKKFISSSCTNVREYIHN